MSWLISKIVVFILAGFQTSAVDKKYECHTCCKTFQRKYHLKRHQLIHSDKRPFKCDLCKEGFNDKSSLRAHCRRLTPCSTESKHWEYWWVESIILNGTCLSILTRGPLYVTFVRKGSMIKLLWESTVEAMLDRTKVLRVLVSFFKIPSVVYSMHCRCHARQNQSTESTGEFFKFPRLFTPCTIEAILDRIKALRVLVSFLKFPRLFTPCIIEAILVRIKAPRVLVSFLNSLGCLFLAL